MSPSDKPLAWLSGMLSSPPLPVAARIEAGFLLRTIQRGVPVGMPHARPIPSIGPGVLELRITDGATRSEWRIVLKREHDVVVVLHFFQKKTQRTPQSVVALCKHRLAAFSHARR